jgi:hypothetical protein
MSRGIPQRGIGAACLLGVPVTPSLFFDFGSLSRKWKWHAFSVLMLGAGQPQRAKMLRQGSSKRTTLPEEEKVGRIPPKEVSLLRGSKLDVIQPDLSRDKIVELLAGQPGKSHDDQFGSWSGSEIQKQRRPSVGTAGEIVR